MPDRRLKYWYDWEIYGPDGKLLEYLKSSVPSSVLPIEKDRLNDPDYLSNLIKEYPNQALMNKDVWYQIVMLRQRAFKNKDEVESLERVCKAITGDGHRRKTQEYLIKLKRIIRRDVKFFRTIQNKISEEKIGIDNAIEKYLTEGERNMTAHDAQINKISNYRNTYYNYKKIYDQLSRIMSQQEIYIFFDEAREHLDDPNAIVDTHPERRQLTFVKKYTWYVEGQDMTTTVD